MRNEPYDYLRKIFKVAFWLITTRFPEMIILFWFVTASKKGHGDAAGSAAFQLLRRHGFFFEAATLFCFAAVLLGGTRHRSFVVASFFCGRETLVIRRVAFWGRATLFCVALAFFGARDIYPLSSQLFCCRETLGFLRGLLGPRDIVCAAAVLFLGARHRSFVVTAFFAAARHWGFVGAASWGRATLFALPFFGRTMPF